MDGPDSREVPHDHPWSFVSFILKGGYDEMRKNPHDTHAPLRLRRHRRMNIMRRDDAHFILRLLKVPTWTLLFMGKRRRTWGYWERTKFDGEWKWTEFDKHPFQNEYEDAMRARVEARLWPKPPSLSVVDSEVS
jgi:hypothetical protein